MSDTTKPARPRRRLARWLVGLVLLLITLLTSGTLFLLRSEVGLNWLFQQAQTLVPGTLEVTRLNGRLTGPLSLQGLKLSLQDGTVLQIEQLALDWRPKALFEGALHITELQIEGVGVELPESEEPDSPAPPFNGFVPPLQLILKSAALNELAITMGSSEPLVIDAIALSGHSEGDRLEITRLEATALNADIVLEGALRLASDLPMSGQIRWRYRLPEGPQLAGKGTLQGNLRQLKLSQTLNGPLAGELQGTLSELDKEVSWDARLQLSRGELAPFLPDFPALLRGELHTTGTVERPRLEARVELEEALIGKVNGVVDVVLQDGRLEIAHLQLETPGDSRIDGSGQWHLSSQSLDMQLGWSGLRWPLQGDSPVVRSEKGQLRLTGPLSDYRYEIDLDLHSPDIPASRLQAKGEGTLEALHFESLQATVLEGSLQGNGTFAWLPIPAWKLELTGEAINPSGLMATLPGRLNLALTTNGSIPPDGLVAAVELKRLEGTLRDYPVHGTGRIGLQGDNLQLEGVNLSSGRNQLSASGEVGARLGLTWQLNAEDLRQLWPGLEGRLKAQGRLFGDRERPGIQASFNGSGLVFQDRQLATLEGRVDLTQDGDGQQQLDLKATGLQIGALHWTRLALGGEGKRSDHRLTLALEDTSAPSVQLSLSGALDSSNRWSGLINRMELREARAGRWRLEKPASLLLGAQRFELAAGCFTSKHGRLCLQAQGDPSATWSASLQGDALSLKLLDPWLPEQLQLTGQLGLSAEVGIDANGQLGGEASATLAQAKSRMELGDTEQQLDISGTRLAAVLSAKGLDGQLHLPLTGIGIIEASARLPGMQPGTFSSTEQPIEGSLDAKLPDLSLLSWFVPDLSAVQGRVDAGFQFSGTLAAPQVRGEAALADGAADIPALGLQVRDIEAQIKTPDLSHLRYHAKASSGDGLLQLEGETLLDASSGWPSKLRLWGENWVATDIPEARLWVSPDLTLNRDSTKTRLEGELTIPYAQLRLRELPETATKGSSDLVVVQAGKPVTKPATDLQLHSRIRLKLGERVSFEGLGLRARLKSDLVIIDEPGRPVLGNGSLHIAEGSYRAYGQDLSIEHGRALFTESPIDNPALELRAVRKAESVTAGIKISGTLKKPTLELFSSPAMTQSDTLSYLLTGRSRDSRSSLGSGAAAAALAASGAGKLTGEVGRQLGLDELRMEAGQSLDEASVVAGTWLSPRLYVQYANGLATRESKLRLRYDLTDKLQIQTESGSSQGADLFYTIER